MSALGQPREAVDPLADAPRAARRRLGLRGELALALLPTAAVLVNLALLEWLSQQRLLFASLASSAFLIYLDPLHITNTLRKLAPAHVLAATIGLLAYLMLGHGYAAAAPALMVTILLLIALDIVHPPAVSTSLIFALRSGAENEFMLFGLALAAVIVTLVLLQRAVVWLLARMTLH